MYISHRGIRLPLKLVHSYIALLAVVVAGACPGRGQGWGTCCTLGNSKPSLAGSPWKVSSKHQLQPSTAIKSHWALSGAVQKGVAGPWAEI